MFDRVIGLLMSGSGAVVLTVSLFMLLWRWGLVLRLEIGWTRRGWLRAPALLALMARSARQKGPVHQRIKLKLMLVVAAVTAPFLWLGFVDAIAGTGLIVSGTGYPREAHESANGFALALAACLSWALAACLSWALAAWVQFVIVVRRKDKVKAEFAAYIAEGEQVLGTGLGETPAAELSRLAMAVLVVWAGIGLVGVIGTCAALGWRLL